MFFKLLQLILLIIVGYFIISFIRLVFNLGRSASEINRKINEMNKGKGQKKGGSRKGSDKNGVIELDKNQYKVE